jgi:scytalone dehydratase
MRVDYRSFLDKIWEALPADEYVAMASDPHVLGDPLLKTQHFIGSSKWEKVSDTEAVGWHQLRVPHQRYTDESRTEIAVKGHAHGSNQHWYRKIDGVWKFAGLAPIIRWGEFDFDKVFASGRETFGDQEKALDEIAVVAGVKGEIADAPAAIPSTIEEAAHTASGVGSTLENMPVEVKAHLMDTVPDKHDSSSMQGLVAA